MGSPPLMPTPRLGTVSPPRAFSETELRTGYASYQRALAMLSTDQLLAEADRVASLIEAQNRETMTSLLLRERVSSLDRSDLDSDPMALPSEASPDRPSPRSGATTPDPPWVALTGSRIAPRLAAHLVIRSARAQARKGL